MTEPIKACTFLDKGGTGKTTTAAHLGVALAEQDLDVLLIDLAGKQGDLAEYFGIYDWWRAMIKYDDHNGDWPNIATTLTDQWDDFVERLGEECVTDMIWSSKEGPDIIPAHPHLDGMDDDLGNVDDATNRYSRLDAFISDYIESLGYDVILIDLPGLTNNVSYNGLWAARNVIAPVEMGPLEEKQANQLHADIDSISTNFEDAELDLAMVLPNKVDNRTKLADEYLTTFEDAYPDAFAPEHVPTSQDIRNACEQGKTVFGLEEPSSTAEQAIAAYRANADALVDRLTGGN